MGGLGCGGGSNERPPPIGEDSGTCIDEDDDGHALPGSCDDGDDCDDTNPAVRPGVPDNPCADLNCDGIGGSDEDADGHLDVECGGDDCDDAHAERNPSLPDVVGNANDDNCDGVDGVDGDDDGIASESSGGTDCDDADRAVFPGADDQVGDAEDLDCDGNDGTDGDGDSYASVASGGDDCNDDSAEVRPGAPDAVGNGIDDDCDGVDGVDADLDGYASEATGGDDCDDEDAAIHLFAQGDWDWEVLTTALRGDAPSAALDSRGAVHVAFIEEDDLGNDQVIWLTSAGGAWDAFVVDQSPNCVAIALDTDDNVHLVYRNDRDLPRYATNAEGAWFTEPVGGTEAKANCTVAVAPDGVIHTIFTSNADAVTHGQREADGTWPLDSLEDDDVETTDVSFQIDSAGFLHVAYSDASGVKYVTDTSGTWVGEPVADGTSAYLALDGDAPRVIFEGIAGERMAYAEPGVKEWAVAVTIWDGLGPHMTFDTDGRAHAVFGLEPEGAEDEAATNVIYARASGGGWTDEPVQPVEGVEPLGRILMDQNDEPIFFVAQQTGDVDDPRTLYIVWRAVRNDVDDDCDGRIW
jgi:hypothetical protein